MCLYVRLTACVCERLSGCLFVCLCILVLACVFDFLYMRMNVFVLFERYSKKARVYFRLKFKES